MHEHARERRRLLQDRGRTKRLCGSAQRGGGTTRRSRGSGRQRNQSKWRREPRGRSALNEQLDELRNKHGSDVETWWQERFGHVFDSLTQSEARYLACTENADTIRNRIAEAEQARDLAASSEVSIG